MLIQTQFDSAKHEVSDVSGEVRCLSGYPVWPQLGLIRPQPFSSQSNFVWPLIWKVTWRQIHLDIFPLLRFGINGELSGNGSADCLAGGRCLLQHPAVRVTSSTLGLNTVLHLACMGGSQALEADQNWTHVIVRAGTCVHVLCVV